MSNNFIKKLFDNKVDLIYKMLNEKEFKWSSNLSGSKENRVLEVFGYKDKDVKAFLRVHLNDFDKNLVMSLYRDKYNDLDDESAEYLWTTTAYPSIIGLTVESLLDNVTAKGILARLIIIDISQKKMYNLAKNDTNFTGISCSTFIYDVPDGEKKKNSSSLIQFKPYSILGENLNRIHKPAHLIGGSAIEIGGPSSENCVIKVTFEDANCYNGSKDRQDLLEKFFNESNISFDDNALCISFTNKKGNMSPIDYYRFRLEMDAKVGYCFSEDIE